MSVGIQYGLLVFVTSTALTEKAPQPLGSVVFWSLLVVQFAYGAVVCWRRTGLPYATASLGVWAAGSALLALLAANGHVLPNLSSAGWVVIAAGVAAWSILMWIESKRNPEPWRAWKRCLERATLWDVLRMRHFPELRGRRS